MGGSPATEQLSSGLESTDVEQDSVSNSNTETLTDNGATIDEEPVWSKENATTAIESDDSSVQHRRELLGSKLNNYKQEKLKGKLPVDS